MADTAFLPDYKLFTHAATPPQKAARLEPNPFIVRRESHLVQAALFKERPATEPITDTATGVPPVTKAKANDGEGSRLFNIIVGVSGGALVLCGALAVMLLNGINGNIRDNAVSIDTLQVETMRELALIREDIATELGAVRLTIAEEAGAIREDLATTNGTLGEILRALQATPAP